MKNPPRDESVQGSGLRAQGHCPQPPAPSPQQGFSLIELLIASAIVAASASLLIGGLVAANRSADLRIEQAVSTQLLASRLALLDDPLGPDTPTHGTFSSPEGFEWTLEWTDAPLAPLVEATLTVTRGSHASSVVTYRSLREP